jgi:Ala-tRNA(Pro) deacylase
VARGGPFAALAGNLFKPRVGDRCQTDFRKLAEGDSGDGALTGKEAGFSQRNVAIALRRPRPPNGRLTFGLAKNLANLARGTRHGPNCAATWPTGLLGAAIGFARHCCKCRGTYNEKKRRLQKTGNLPTAWMRISPKWKTAKDGLDEQANRHCAKNQLRDGQGARPAHSPQDRRRRPNPGCGMGGSQGTGLNKARVAKRYQLAARRRGAGNENMHPSAKAVTMPMPVFEQVENLLGQYHVDFTVLRHEPVYTSEEAARIRGTTLSSGAKALICKGDDTKVMFVLPADRKLASSLVRRAYGWKKLRFATREEVLELTGLTPGSIPPFGSLFHLTTYCDQRLSENEVINFNAGDHGISVSMSYRDYLTVEKPELGTFAE